MASSGGSNDGAGFVLGRFYCWMREAMGLTWDVVVSAGLDKQRSRPSVAKKWR